MLRRFTNNTVYRTVGYYTIFFYLTLFLFLFLYRFLKLFWYHARHSFQRISDIQAHNTSVYSPKIEFLCASIFYEHFHFNCFFSVWFTVEEGKNMTSTTRICQLSPRHPDYLLIKDSIWYLNKMTLKPI